MKLNFDGKMPQGSFRFSCLCNEEAEDLIIGFIHEYVCKKCNSRISFAQLENSWEMTFAAVCQSIHHHMPKRYIIMSYHKDIGGSGCNSYDFFEDAVEEFSKYDGKINISDVIFLDTMTSKVYIIKGTEEPFKKTLDTGYAGWEFGAITRTDE